MVVVLPAPFGPRKACTSPARTSRSRPSRAAVRPNDLRRARISIAFERVPGSRRDYYRMPGNMWDDLLRMRDQVMSRWGALVREGIDLVGPDTAAGARMAEQAAFLEFATREMAGLLTRWEKYRAERA
jgi:hypothetical protein